MLNNREFKEGARVVFSDEVPQMAGRAAVVVEQYHMNEVTVVNVEGALLEVFTDCLEPLTLH